MESGAFMKMSPRCSRGFGAAGMISGLEQVLGIDAVVHPLEAGKARGFFAALEQLVAQLALHARRVVDVAVKTRGELNAAGAQVARLLVFLKGRLDVAIGGA